MFALVLAQQCTSNDFIIENNGDQIFTISSVNKSCICQSFAGDGSNLTGMNNQPTVMAMNQTITNLNAQTVNLTIQYNNALEVITNLTLQNNNMQKKDVLFLVLNASS